MKKEEKGEYMPLRLGRLLGLIVALLALYGSTGGVLGACNGGTKAKSINTLLSSEEERQIPPDTVRPPFPLPEIPLVMNSPRERALYYAAHYWDECNFLRGDDYLQDSKAMERVFVDFLGVVLSLPLEAISPYLTIPAQRAQGNLFKFFESMYKKHLYEADSPLKNEEYYLFVLEWYASSPKTDFAMSERIKMLLKLVKSNRLGEVANDFTFVLTDGEVRQLSHFRGKPTILFFFTPGCSGCQEKSRSIVADDNIVGSVVGNRVNLLYICSGNDPEGFKRGLSEIPPFATAAINADESVQNALLYDLKTSPTLFLLDKESKVLLKDTTIEEISKHIAGTQKISTNKNTLPKVTRNKTR